MSGHTQDNTDPSPTHTIELQPSLNSEIAFVNLYSGRAEIARVFEVDLEEGENQVIISKLPNAMDKDSLRVEGKGQATIHDVIVSELDAPLTDDTPELLALRDRKKLVEAALERCGKTTKSLESYISSINVEHLDVSKLDNVLDAYNEAGSKLDLREQRLEKELEELTIAIEKEHTKQEEASSRGRLFVRVVALIHATEATRVALKLIYGVVGATWDAKYTIRVDSTKEEQMITVIYKAAIINKTGETWNNAPLTLETIKPVFNLTFPTIHIWKLSSVESGRGLGGGGAKRHRKIINEGSIDYYDLDITSKGSISATFSVPGKITIPSDGAYHNVTISQLELEGSLLWVTIPKVDRRVHLKAQITNTSGYTLVPGEASIYVDGSFISRTEIDLVNAGETFECPLGIDPTARVTYHPYTKKTTQYGFYNKETVHTFSRRITVSNTKRVAIERLKIVDNIPVTSLPTTSVKLLEPNLTLPASLTPMKIEDESSSTGSAIHAQWDGTDAPKPDMETLGKTGMVNWVCRIPPQGQVSSTLKWEVSTTTTEEIHNLDPIDHV